MGTRAVLKACARRAFVTEQHHRNAGRHQRAGAKHAQGHHKPSRQRRLEQQAAEAKTGKQRERHQGHGLPARAVQVGCDGRKLGMGQIETER